MEKWETIFEYESSFSEMYGTHYEATILNPNIVKPSVGDVVILYIDDISLDGVGNVMISDNGNTKDAVSINSDKGYFMPFKNETWCSVIIDSQISMIMFVIDKEYLISKGIEPQGTHKIGLKKKIS